MTSQRPLGAQISHMLKARGVEVIFGIPGVHNQEMYRGIEEAGLSHVLARHEQGAGFMADGYARATGRPGVCYVISGPGLTNIMTPMGQAYSDSVPLLVISSCLDETAATRGQLHQMKDQEAAARCVADWSETARTADAAYALIDRALSEFETRRARPKHLSVPIRLLEAPAAPAPGTPVTHDARSGEVRDADVSELADLLRGSKRPVLILGGGLRSGRGAQAVAEAAGAAIFTTQAGRGLVPADHPLSFGGMLPAAGSARVLAGADLVVAIGTELSESDLWRDELGHDGPLVRIDRDPEMLGDRHAAQYRYLSDAEAFMAALERRFAGTSPVSGWQPQEIAETVARWRAGIDASRPHILPVAVALRDCVPEDTMIYSDMTQFAYAANQLWPMAAARHWHHPTGFGTLGYALPAAIGGAVGRPGRPTLAIAGDYGFQYTLQELATAVELGLSLPIFLWDNGKLGEIEDSMIAAQIAPNAVIQRNPDFLKLAEAYGARSAAPQTLGAMQDAVRTAFDAPVPTIIRVTPSIKR